MTFTKEFLAELKSKVSLVELADEYTDLTKELNDEWRGPCPHPDHSDSDPSFTIFLKNNEERWYCFGCDTGGDCIDFIKWISGDDMTWRDAVLFLANKYNVNLPTTKHDKEYKRNKLLANKYHKDLKERAYNYLYERGLNNDDSDKWLIGYDKYSDRIVFPMHDRLNNIIGFNKRTLEPKSDKKYIHSANSEIFKKSNYFYGTNHISNKYEYIIITEGVMDVILATKYGLKNVICTLGVALTKDHIPFLKTLDKTIVLIYDGDAKGISAINKAAKLLLDNNIYCKTVILPEGKDLADISLEHKKDLYNYINSIMCTYGYYNAKNIIDEYNKELYELKLRYQPMLNNIIKNIPDQEKNTIKCFLENEIGLKVTD